MHRLWVKGGMSTRDDQRVIPGSLGSPQRNAGQIQGIERVGVQGFVGQTETQDVEGSQRVVGFK